MNLFVLDYNHKTNVAFHVDRHVVKMPLEAAQILCSVRHLYGDDTARYKLTHINHPCVKWASESVLNYMWVVDYGLALCNEYSFRYNKQHACESVIQECYCSLPDISNMLMTDHALCMPDQYKQDDCVKSYRSYYINEKSKLFKWTSRKVPYWIECGVKGKIKTTPASVSYEINSKPM